MPLVQRLAAPLPDSMPEPRVAYLVSRYPAVSHTFIVREVQALRALGASIDTFSIRRTPQEQLLSPADREEARRTFTLLPLKVAGAIRSHLSAVAASPACYVKMWRRATRLARPGLRGLFLAASWSVEAPVLWHQLRRRGFRHVHVHMDGTPPAVAMLGTEFANGVDRDVHHGWSLTVHGPNEFYDVAGDALAEKVRSADFVVCISDFARSQLMAFVEEEHWPKLHVVHCGVDLNAYTARAGARDMGSLQLLSVGRLTQIKGQTVLLEALAELRSRGVAAELTLVGDGPKRGYLEGAAKRLGLDAAVRFTGAVGQDEIARYYEQADVYVHASFAEGIPVVLMEAMAHRLPVVAAAVMGVPELVRDGHNGILVRPGRPNEIVAAVEPLAAEPQLRDRLGEAGRNTVAAEFDVASSAAVLSRLFARYLDPTAAPKTASTTRAAAWPSSRWQKRRRNAA